MQGYDFVNKCVCVIEDRGESQNKQTKKQANQQTPLFLHTGLDDEAEGLYRKPGIVSKANKLLKDCMEKGKLDKIDFSDEFELDTKTIASAVKGYFSKHLGEPLLTFQLHSQFIEAASR